MFRNISRDTRERIMLERDHVIATNPDMLDFYNNFYAPNQILISQRNYSISVQGQGSNRRASIMRFMLEFRSPLEVLDEFLSTDYRNYCKHPTITDRNRFRSLVEGVVNGDVEFVDYFIHSMLNSCINPYEILTDPRENEVDIIRDFVNMAREYIERERNSRFNIHLNIPPLRFNNEAPNAPVFNFGIYDDPMRLHTQLARQLEEERNRLIATRNRLAETTNAPYFNINWSVDPAMRNGFGNAIRRAEERANAPAFNPNWSTDAVRRNMFEVLNRRAEERANAPAFNPNGFGGNNVPTEWPGRIPEFQWPVSRGTSDNHE